MVFKISLKCNTGSSSCKGVELREPNIGPGLHNPGLAKQLCHLTRIAGILLQKSLMSLSWKMLSEYLKRQIIYHYCIFNKDLFGTPDENCFNEETFFPTRFRTTGGVREMEYLKIEQ